MGAAYIRATDYYRRGQIVELTEGQAPRHHHSRTLRLKKPASQNFFLASPAKNGLRSKASSLDLIPL